MSEQSQEKTPSVFDGPGRGRKKCAGCGKYIGVRNKVCFLCGYNFPSKYTSNVKVTKLQQNTKKATATVSKDDSKPKMKLPRGIDPNKWIHRILIPAGKCPAKLESTDREAIQEWIAKIEKVYTANNEILLPKGYRYYARHFYDVHTEPDEFKLVQQTITEILQPGEQPDLDTE